MFNLYELTVAEVSLRTQEGTSLSPTRRETIDFFSRFFFKFLPKIPVAARVQTTFFGLPMVYNNDF